MGPQSNSGRAGRLSVCLYVLWNLIALRRGWRPAKNCARGPTPRCARFKEHCTHKYITDKNIFIFLNLSILKYLIIIFFIHVDNDQCSFRQHKRRIE